MLGWIQAAMQQNTIFILPLQKEIYQSQIYKNFGTVCHTDRPLTLMASKTALPNILKIASNLCGVWMVGRDQPKTKRPQQAGVISNIEP